MSKTRSIRLSEHTEAQIQLFQKIIENNGRDINNGNMSVNSIIGFVLDEYFSFFMEPLYGKKTKYRILRSQVNNFIEGKNTNTKMQSKLNEILKVVQKNYLLNLVHAKETTKAIPEFYKELSSIEKDSWERDVDNFIKQIIDDDRNRNILLAQSKRGN